MLTQLHALGNSTTILFWLWTTIAPGCRHSHISCATMPCMCFVPGQQDYHGAPKITDCVPQPALVQPIPADLLKSFSTQSKYRSLMYKTTSRLAETSPNLRKDTDIQAQKYERVLNKINPMRPIPIHTIIRITKLKIDNLEDSKKKTTSHIKKQLQ